MNDDNQKLNSPVEETPAEEMVAEAAVEHEAEASPAEAADEENNDVIPAEVEDPVRAGIQMDPQVKPEDDKNNEASTEDTVAEETAEDEAPADEGSQALGDTVSDNPNVKWYVVHTYSGHENKVATALKQRVEAEHLEHKILDVLVPTQEKIEIRGGKKATVKEKIFPGYILVKMDLDDSSWLAVRTTQGVTSFIGIGNKPTPIPEAEVRTIVRFMTQGAAPTFKDVFMVDDTVKIVDGPFSEFIGKVDGVDKEKGKVRVLVSIFGRETPVELDFLQVQKL
jgi:transcriptional antiterminator NusG